MAKVNWTFQALEDVNGIADYLSQNSESYASHIIGLIFEKSELLKSFPKLGRILPESNINSIRELIIKKYRIIYSISSKNNMDIHSSKPLNDFPASE